MKQPIVSPFPKELDELHFSLRDARVVGMGEFVHGSSKLHRTMGQFALQLILSYQSRLILLEAPEYSAAQVNYLIQPGQMRELRLDDLDPLYGIWRTEGVLSTLENIRKLNQNLDTPVQLKGFDIRQPISEFVELSKILLDLGQSNLAKDIPFSLEIEQLRKVENDVFLNIQYGSGSLRDYLLIKSNIKTAKDLISAHAHFTEKVSFDKVDRWMKLYDTMINSGLTRAFSTRDAFLFESVRQMLDKVKNDSPTILIAHFGHLVYDNLSMSKAPSVMMEEPVLGSYLRQILGKKYFLVGFGNKVTNARQFDGSIKTYVTDKTSIESAALINTKYSFLLPSFGFSPSNLLVHVGLLQNSDNDINSSYSHLEYKIWDQAGAYNLEK